MAPIHASQGREPTTGNVRARSQRKETKECRVLGCPLTLMRLGQLGLNFGDVRGRRQVMRVALILYPVRKTNRRIDTNVSEFLARKKTNMGRAERIWS
uniref:Uncharacterized protein n=1 Tax=Solanum lycopersicum TaxID=4081 RepID=A0A3Q7IGV9_SOLLC